MSKVWILNGRGGDEIDRPVKERFEGFKETEIRVSVGTRGKRLELDEEVEVAGIWEIMSSGSRAEQFEAAHVVRPTQMFKHVLVWGYDWMHEVISHATRYSGWDNRWTCASAWRPCGSA